MTFKYTSSLKEFIQSLVSTLITWNLSFEVLVLILLKSSSFVIFMSSFIVYLKILTNFLLYHLKRVCLEVTS